MKLTKGLHVLGIAGKKGSGKTSLARELQGYFSSESDGLLKYLMGPVKVGSFAGPLKQTLSKLLGINPTDWVDKDRIHAPSGKTYRELLQLVGTDWFRSLDPEVWVTAAFKEMWMSVKSGETMLYVYDDVRFPNEIQAIHDVKGKVIYLYRDGPRDEHASENSVMSYDCDVALDCRSLSIEEVRNEALNYLEGVKWLSS